MGVRDTLARVFGRRSRGASDSACAAPPARAVHAPAAGSPSGESLAPLKRIARHSQLPEIDATCVEIDSAPVAVPLAAAASAAVRVARTDSDGGAAPMPAVPPVPPEAKAGPGEGAGRQPGAGYSTPGQADGDEGMVPALPHRPSRRRYNVPAIPKGPIDKLVAGPPPAQLAARLHAWIMDTDEPPETMWAHEVQEAYGEMCAELLWQPRPWNPIAKHLAPMTGGKRYGWCQADDGSMHRLRLYRFRDAAADTVDSDPVPSARPRGVRAWIDGMAADGERAAA